MKFRLSDIKNFIETAACATMTQAALKLEISQPALSESLKRLESDARAILFYRSRSGIQLTPSGRVFLVKAEKMIAAYQELDMNTQSPYFTTRKIVIGCHPTVAQYSIPKALAFLKESAPEYKIELQHDLSRNIQMQIQNGQIDIGLVINPVSVPDLVIQKIGFDTVGVWSSGPSEKQDTVICNPHLFQTQSILKKWKDKPKKMISTDSLELICQLVSEKIGLGILPERAVQLSKLNLKPLFVFHQDHLYHI